MRCAGGRGAGCHWGRPAPPARPGPPRFFLARSTCASSAQAGSDGMATTRPPRPRGAARESDCRSCRPTSGMSIAATSESTAVYAASRRPSRVISAHSLYTAPPPYRPARAKCRNSRLAGPGSRSSNALAGRPPKTRSSEMHASSTNRAVVTESATRSSLRATDVGRWAGGRFGGWASSSGTSGRAPGSVDTRDRRHAQVPWLQVAHSREVLTSADCEGGCRLTAGSV